MTKWVEEVYVASNGDIFFKHNQAYVENSEFDLNDAINQANEKLSNGEFVIVQGKEDKDLFTSYHDQNGIFLGHGDMHITEKYDELQDKIFLVKSNKFDFFKKSKKAFNEAVKRDMA